MTNSLIRLLAIAIAGLGLIATIGVTATTPAAADDGSARATRFVLKGDPYKRVGTKRAAQLKAAQSINEHATGPKRKVLDYKLADKYDKGHKTVRRQFAASWLWSGRTIKHISKKERKIVKSYVKKHFGKAKAPAGLGGVETSLWRHSGRAHRHEDGAVLTSPSRGGSADGGGRRMD